MCCAGSIGLAEEGEEELVQMAGEIGVFLVGSDDVGGRSEWVCI